MPSVTQASMPSARTPRTISHNGVEVAVLAAPSARPRPCRSGRPRPFARVGRAEHLLDAEQIDAIELDLAVDAPIAGNRSNPPGSRRS